MENETLTEFQEHKRTSFSMSEHIHPYYFRNKFLKCKFIIIRLENWTKSLEKSYFFDNFGYLSPLFICSRFALCRYQIGRLDIGGIDMFPHTSKRPSLGFSAEIDRIFGKEKRIPTEPNRSKSSTLRFFLMSFRQSNTTISTCID